MATTTMFGREDHSGLMFNGASVDGDSRNAVIILPPATTTAANSGAKGG